MKIGHVDNYYKELSRTELTLRRLLWLRHGHDGLYGDDGEMQCGRCRLDFLRNSVLVIEESFERQGLELMRRTEMTESKTVDEMLAMLKRARIYDNWAYIESAITSLVAERDQALKERDDSDKQLDEFCWDCNNADSGYPERHVHEPNGGHWHHYIDPGDGLPSPCKNSDMLEWVFQEINKERDALKARVAELEKARDQAEETLKREVIIRDKWLQDANEKLKESQEFVKTLRADVTRLNSEDMRF